MAMPDRQRLGPGAGTLLLRTSRQGLAADVGHDLTIEVTDWSGEFTPPGADGSGAVEVTVRTGSLRVLAGTGGVKPLSDKDKREILGHARRILDSDRRPEASFRADIPADLAEGGTLTGTLTLLGADRPLRLTATSLGERRYRITGTVVQSDYGIRPYSAFLSMLKLADPVIVEIEIELTGARG